MLTALDKTASTRLDRPAPRHPGDRLREIAYGGHILDVTDQAPRPGYAVLTPDSLFPAGWVRFDRARGGYLFCTLQPGRAAGTTPAPAPAQAVPDWVGPHRLRKIHPLPEHLTGDMLAAAPRMLETLKGVYAALEAGTPPPLDREQLGALIAMAEGRD